MTGPRHWPVLVGGPGDGEPAPPPHYRAKRVPRYGWPGSPVQAGGSG